MISLFKFVVGTVWGSFLTLSAIRVNRSESVVFPPSHCDHCGHKLKPWELIPIISFLILRGKCHQCHHSIGITTLMGEIIGGLIIMVNPLTLSGILESAFEILLLFIAECDLRSYLIPTWSLLLLLTIPLSHDLINKSYTLLLTALILYIVISLFISHYNFFGNGDVDLLFIIFLKINLQVTLLIILLSSGLAILKYTAHHVNLRIPYTPYIAISYMIIHQLII